MKDCKCLVLPAIEQWGFFCSLRGLMTLTPVAEHLAVDLSLPVLTYEGCHSRDLNTNPLYARQMLYLMCHHSDSRDRMGAYRRLVAAFRSCGRGVGPSGRRSGWCQWRRSGSCSPSCSRLSPGSGRPPTEYNVSVSVCNVTHLQNTMYQSVFVIFYNTMY